MSFKKGKAMRNLVIVTEVDHQRVLAETKALELGLELGKANARIATMERLLAQTRLYNMGTHVPLRWFIDRDKAVPPAVAQDPPPSSTPRPEK